MSIKTAHPKYKLKENDSIQSITKLFGVKESVWVQYHNNMCRLDNVIKDVLPQHLTEIYLLPELWDKAEEFNTIAKIDNIAENKESQKARLGYHSTLPMKRHPEILNYGIQLFISNNEKDSAIKYQVSIRWVEKEENQHIIEINRISDTYIDNKLPDLMADELAIKTAAALYPMELIITRKDGIIGINNFQQIQKRWEDTKRRIRDYYAGETLEKYLRLNDKVLASEEILLRSLYNDWFLHIYFNKIYQTYGVGHSFTNSVSVPFLFDTKGVEYTVLQKINDEIDHNGFIQISMEGKVTDERSLTDMDKHLNNARYDSDIPVTGSYKANYRLDAKYYTIDKVVSDCSLNLESNKRVAMIITRIKI